jgi:hypothetical protein
MGVEFVSALWFFPVNTIPNNISHLPQSTCYCYQKYNWAEFGNLAKTLENLEPLSVKVCFLLSLRWLQSIMYGTNSRIAFICDFSNAICHTALSVAPVTMDHSYVAVLLTAVCRDSADSCGPSAVLPALTVCEPANGEALWLPYGCLLQHYSVPTQNCASHFIIVCRGLGFVTTNSREGTDF